MIQMDERARIIEVFRKNLANLISERNLTQREFAKMVGVSAPTVNDWLKGKTSPRMNKIDKICSIFAIKRSDLLDPPAEPAPPAAQPPTAPYHPELTKRDELTEHEREHIELYRELDERGRNAVDDLTDLHVERVRESTERSSGSTGTENAAEKRA